MLIKRLIPIQLFCILFTTKTTFGRPNNEQPEYEMNVLITWDRSLVEMKNLSTINERFQLELCRMDRQTGKAIWPSITSAKTGHYDLGRLIVPPQHIDIQNADVEEERRRKGKEKVEMESAKNMNSENGAKFRLRIQMNLVLSLSRRVWIFYIALSIADMSFADELLPMMMVKPDMELFISFY